MKEVIINRLFMDETITLGVMQIENVPMFFTLELPWKDNAKDISCIPEGKYIAGKSYSPKFGQVYEVLNVPDRDRILIHWGNTVNDINGCILIGRMAGLLNGERAVIATRDAIVAFHAEIEMDEQFTLIIRNRDERY